MQHSVQGANLADILERVLDKGIVIAGDITISLVQVELLSIKVRLLIASVDKAREMGINWWESDPFLSTRTHQIEEENRLLRERLDLLERRLELAPALITTSEQHEAA
ncbi:MAG: gas vesicle protein [Roseiflexaceae bacterium]|nr:gas vesicle protein [Roseiflexaceae bacterium]